MPDRPLPAPRASDAFSAGIDVACVAALRRALEDPGHAAACLAGPSGAARADLLHALTSALAARCRPVLLRCAALPTGGLWMRVADALELASGYDARRRVLRLAGELSCTGQALLLVLDHAERLPADTLHAVLATARSQPGLWVVLAHPEGERLAGAPPEDVAVVRGVAPAGARAAAPAPRAAAEGPDASDSTSPAGPEAPAEPPALAPAARGDAVPPWREPFAAPGRPGRRAARERRRERRRRLAFGAAGLALGLVAAAALDADRWRSRAARWLGAGAGDERSSAAAPPPAVSAPVVSASRAGGAEAQAPLPPVGAAAPGGRAAHVRTLETPPPAPEAWARGAEAPAAPAVGPRSAPADEPSGALEAPAPGAPEDAPRAAAAPFSLADRPAAPAPPPRSGPPAVAAPLPSGGPPAPARPLPPAAPPAAAAPPVTSAPVASAPVTSAPVAAAPVAAAAVASRPVTSAPPVGAPPPPAPVRRRGPLAPGSLSIASESPVRIEIDGERFGTTPLGGVRLARGEHRVLAHFPDGSVAQKTIVLGDEDLAVEFR